MAISVICQLWHAKNVRRRHHLHAVQVEKLLADLCCHLRANIGVVCEKAVCDRTRSWSFCGLDISNPSNMKTLREKRWLMASFHEFLGSLKP